MRGARRAGARGSDNIARMGGVLRPQGKIAARARTDRRGRHKRKRPFRFTPSMTSHSAARSSGSKSPGLRSNPRQRVNARHGKRYPRHSANGARTRNRHAVDAFEDIAVLSSKQISLRKRRRKPLKPVGKRDANAPNVNRPQREIKPGRKTPQTAALRANRVDISTRRIDRTTIARIPRQRGHPRHFIRPRARRLPVWRNFSTERPKDLVEPLIGAKGNVHD